MKLRFSPATLAAILVVCDFFPACNFQGALQQCLSPPVTKHLENLPSVDDFPSWKPPFRSGFFIASHVGLSKDTVEILGN